MDFASAGKGERASARSPRPRLLDLFCGAGGAAAGYAAAGFEVWGVDSSMQPRYPFRFFQADALAFMRALIESGERFDVVHASPPCQAYSAMRHLSGRTYPELVEPVRELLVEYGVPYVIENVVGAPLRGYVQLCGTSFGVPLRRHRWFESSEYLMVPPCAHELFPAVLSRLHRTKGGDRSRYVGVYGGTRSVGDGARARQVMGIEWMQRHELTQAIPPAYTELLGKQLYALVRPH